jgi:hypothetical protein
LQLKKTRAVRTARVVSSGLASVLRTDTSSHRLDATVHVLGVASVGTGFGGVTVLPPAT